MAQTIESLRLLDETQRRREKQTAYKTGFSDAWAFEESLLMVGVPMIPQDAKAKELDAMAKGAYRLRREPG